MKYENIRKGNFISRPNRFIGKVIIDGQVCEAHIKNTGRCRELLTYGSVVYLEDFAGRMGTRRLRYSLIAAEKGNALINMDSHAPNKVCEESLLSGSLRLPDMEKLTIIKREKTYGGSRFDFYIEDEEGSKGWLEVKGVTLEADGIARFPDAPTERGVKHIRELQRAVKEGYKGYILFIIQMEKADRFESNDDTHYEFGQALREAIADGVHVLAYSCSVTPDTLELGRITRTKF